MHNYCFKCLNISQDKLILKPLDGACLKQVLFDCGTNKAKLHLFTKMAAAMKTKFWPSLPYRQIGGKISQDFPKR